MGLDLYIEARIKEKARGTYISKDPQRFHMMNDDDAYFEICRWCGWDNENIRKRMIEICNEHGGTSYTEQDFSIPFPASALREICKYIFSCSCLLDEEEIEDFPIPPIHVTRHGHEKMNSINARKLYEVIENLDYCIKYENEFCMYDKVAEFIPEKADRISIRENPQAYEWEFRIFNSY